jgi:hypothetical protein
MPNQRSPRSTKTSFSLSKKLLVFIQNEANKRGQTVSEFFRYLIFKYFDEQKRMAPKLKP